MELYYHQVYAREIYKGEMQYSVLALVSDYWGTCSPITFMVITHAHISSGKVEEPNSTIHI